MIDKKRLENEIGMIARKLGIEKYSFERKGGFYETCFIEDRTATRILFFPEKIDGNDAIIIGPAVLTASRIIGYALDGTFSIPGRSFFQEMADRL